MLKFLLTAAACLALSACASRTQMVGASAGALGGAVIGGPVGAVVGGTAGAVVTAPGMPLGGHSYRCSYRDRYGVRHYRWCHS